MRLWAGETAEADAVHETSMRSVAGRARWKQRAQANRQLFQQLKQTQDVGWLNDEALTHSVAAIARLLNIARVHYAAGVCQEVTLLEQLDEVRHLACVEDVFIALTGVLAPELAALFQVLKHVSSEP